MSILKIENLGVRLGGAWTLWDVHLEVEAGEILGVFGWSGSGKSVLARSIAGLQHPTSGEISFNVGEIDITKAVASALDKPAYAPEMTLYENLDMFASLWGMSKKARTRELAFILELFKLGDLRNIKASNLSLGALRRMEIARAILSDAPLILIDSLVDTLDTDIFEKFWDHLHTICRGGRTSVIIFSSSGKVAELCSRIAVINRGRLGYIGKPDEFRKLAGEDMVVLGDMKNPMIKSRVQEKLAVVISEEEGFLSFRVNNGETVVGDLLSEFGAELGCVYFKRPTLEDALSVLAYDDRRITVEDPSYTDET